MSTGAERRWFGRALVAVRPGETSARLWTTLARFLAHGTDLIVCHVELRPTGEAGNELDGQPANEEELRTLQALRGGLVAHLGPEGQRIPIRVLHGDPGQRIVEFAEYTGSELIILGTRAPPSLGKALRGSVSKYVVGNARCSVLAVAE